MENFEISASDMMAKVPVNDFRSAWEQIGDACEVKSSFALKYKSLVEGVAAVMENVGMQPCENTAVPQPNATSHFLFLSGVFVGGIKVLVKSRIVLDEQTGGMILQVREVCVIGNELRTDGVCRWLCVRRKKKLVRRSSTALDKHREVIKWRFVCLHEESFRPQTEQHASYLGFVLVTG